MFQQILPLMNTIFVFRPAAGLLMNFSKGCDTVLGIVGSINKPSISPSTSEGSEGYHSDSDSDDHK